MFPAAVLYALLAVSAVSAQLSVPSLLYPHSGTTWFAGQFHNVTWNVSSLSSSSGTGSLSLSKGGVASAVPIASGFSLAPGRVVVQVPPVEPGSDYAFLLTADDSATSSALGSEFEIDNTTPTTSSFVPGTSVTTGSVSGSTSATGGSSVTASLGTSASGIPATTLLSTSVAPSVGTSASGTIITGGSITTGSSSGVTITETTSTVTSPAGSSTGTGTGTGTGTSSSFTSTSTSVTTTTSAAKTSSAATPVLPLRLQGWIVPALVTVIGLVTGAGVIL